MDKVETYKARISEIRQVLDNDERFIHDEKSLIDVLDQLEKDYLTQKSYLDARLARLHEMRVHGEKMIVTLRSKIRLQSKKAKHTKLATKHQKLKNEIRELERKQLEEERALSTR